MKKISLMMLVFCILASSVITYAQQQKFKFVRVSRDVKKETRRYEKEGWKVTPGSLPISQQLNDSYTKQLEVDDQSFPKYIIADGSAVAQSQAAAEMQAIETAKLRLVGLVQSQMKSVIEADIANNQISNTEAVSVTKAMEVAANRVSKRLGRIMVIFKVIRPVKSNTELSVKIAYSYELARKAMLDEMKVELEKESEDMRAKYEKFLNPDLYKQGEIVNSTETESK